MGASRPRKARRSPRPAQPRRAPHQRLAHAAGADGAHRAAPPLSHPEIAAVAAVKSGDVASKLSLRHADDEIKRAFGDRGYLSAAVSHEATLDSANHTASYTFAISAGDVYHLASVDTSALTPAQQATFAQNFHAAPGAVADKALRDQIIQALSQMNLMRSVAFNLAIDNTQHTVVYVLK